MSIRRFRLLSFVSHGILPSRDGIVMLMCAFSGDLTFVDRNCDGVTFVMFSFGVDVGNVAFIVGFALPGCVDVTLVIDENFACFGGNDAFPGCDGVR